MFNISNPSSFVVVDLSCEGATHTVVFPPGEERGVVVGSTPLADFRIRGPRVAPVQFHFERGEEGVWLIPAYGIHDLRVNAARVLGPAVLEASNVIEFGGVRVSAGISETDTDPGAEERDDASLDASYSSKLPGEEDATHVAMPFVAGVEVSVNERRTQNMPRAHVERTLGAAGDDGERLDITTQRLPPFKQAPDHPRDSSPPLTANGTEIMPVYRPATAAMNDRPSQTLPQTPRASPPAAEPAPARTENIQLVRLRNAPRPPAKPQPQQPAPARVPTKPVSLLARLGLLTKAHPFLVGCCAGIGAFVLAALPLVAARALPLVEQAFFGDDVRAMHAEGHTTMQASSSAKPPTAASGGEP